MKSILLCAYPWPCEKWSNSFTNAKIIHPLIWLIWQLMTLKPFNWEISGWPCQPHDYVSIVSYSVTNVTSLWWAHSSFFICLSITSHLYLHCLIDDPVNCDTVWSLCWLFVMLMTILLCRPDVDAFDLWCDQPRLTIEGMIVDDTVLVFIVY